MADIHRLPNARKVEEEASDWIARLNADDVTTEDRARFETWRRAHPLHAQAFEELLRTWNRFLKAGQSARAAGFAECSSAGADYPRRRRWSFGLAAAAALVAVSLLLGLYLARSAPPTLFRTAIGEQLAIRLPDGSLMQLNTNSVARVDYSSHQRLIHLDRGEAFFKVEHDASRPFWVGAGAGWVRDVGTEFDVYLRARSVQVTVSQGTVRLGASRESLAQALPPEGKSSNVVTLTRGAQGDLSGGLARAHTLSPGELAEVTAWRTGTIYFDNRPLGQVVAELNRYSDDQLVVEDSKLAGLRVGGDFRTNPDGAAAMLSMLEQNFGIRVRREGNHIYLRRFPAPQDH